MKSLKRKFYFNELDSTSAFLKRGRFFLRNFTFVSCDFQTDGHGRLGRTWVSPKGENLLFSVLIKDKKLIQNYSSLSLCSAVSVLKVLNKLSVANLSIKWPNDVYIDGKKVCGILLESVSDNNKLSSIIIGIGLNVNTKNFVGEFNALPTSICLETGKIYDIKHLKKLVFRSLKNDLIKLKKGKSDYLKLARENNYLKDKCVFAEIDNEKRQIKVLDIDDDDSLIYNIDGKTKKTSSGEITFHL